ALVAMAHRGSVPRWTSCAAALTLASICCVLYSVSASPFRSLTLLMQTLVLLSLFSFVVKFGLMVQVTDLWQFLLFLFPLLTTMQLLKLQWPKYAGLWGQLIVFMGSFIAVTNPPVYDYAAFFNDNLSKIVGVGFAWLAFAVLSPGSDARKGRRHIRALRRHFVDQLSRHPQHSEHEFESLVYHHVSQLSQSKDALARRWLLRWGVVLLNCSHVVWQLREWETRSDPLAQVRDLCINLLRDVMSERGVAAAPAGLHPAGAAADLHALNHHHQPARGNWPRDLATVLRPVAAGTGPGGRHNWRRNYLITPQANRSPPPPSGCGLSAMLSPPTWTISAFPFTSASVFRRGAIIGWSATPASLTTSRGRSPRCPAPNGPSCLPVCCGS
ncbi:hypothetical protein CKQ90_20625, partial [Klebsiella pneumoniae]